MRMFEVTHFWIDVFRADEFLARLASGLEFKFCKIRRKQMIRIICLTIAASGLFFSSDSLLIKSRGGAFADGSARVLVQVEFVA